MRYTLLFIILFYTFSFSHSLFSQSTFQSYFGQGTPSTDSFDIIATEDGGFLVSGFITQEGTINSDFYVIKLTENGEEEWSFRQDFDLGAHFDVCIDAVELNDYFAINSVGRQLADGSGSPAYPLVLLLNKSTGEMEKIIELADFAFQYFSKIDKTQNEDLIVYGYAVDSLINTLPNTNPAMTIVKITSDGIISVKNYLETQIHKGLIFDDNDIFIDEADNIYLAGGGIRNSNFLLNLAKIDADGNLLWLIENSENENAKKLETQSDGLLVTTVTRDLEPGHLMKYDFDGNFIWAKDYRELIDQLISIASNENDEIYVVGNKEHNFVLLKTDAYGEIIWDKKFIPASPIKRYKTSDMTLTKDGGVVISGFMVLEGETSPESLGIFVYRLNSEGEFGDILDTASTPLFNTASIDIFPNPTTDNIRIQNQAENIEELQITLYDMQANKIHQTIMNGQQSDIQMKHLPAGSYILELRNQKNQAYRKLVVKQ